MRKTLTIIQWILSIFIILIGLTNMANAPLGAIFIIISGLLILAPILRIIKRKFTIYNNVINTSICLVAFIIGVAITGNSSTATNANEIAMQNQQSSTITNNAIQNTSSNSIQNQIANETSNNINIIENTIEVKENNADNKITINETQTIKEEQNTKKPQTTNKIIENNTPKQKSNKTNNNLNTKKATTQKQEKTNNNNETTNKENQNTQPSTNNVSEVSYILNKNTLTFHKPNCPSVKRMNENNKVYSNKSRAEIISNSYKPCHNCNP